MRSPARWRSVPLPGIPYRLIGAVSFYERREVKDLLAYLRLIANAADDGAFARVVNVPRRGLGDASLAILGAAATRWGKPLLEVARAADRVEGLRPNLRETFHRFAATIDRLREAFGERDRPPRWRRDRRHRLRPIPGERAGRGERLDNVRELWPEPRNGPRWRQREKKEMGPCWSAISPKRRSSPDR